jgi:hypothetical protein
MLRPSGVRAPDGHTITFYLDGYRTVRHNIYVRSASTFKLRDALEQLPPGAASEPPLLVPVVPTPPAGSYRMPGTQPPLSPPLAITAQPVLGVGTLDLGATTNGGRAHRRTALGQLRRCVLRRPACARDAPDRGHRDRVSAIHQ